MNSVNHFDFQPHFRSFFLSFSVLKHILSMREQQGILGEELAAAQSDVRVGTEESICFIFLHWPQHFII